jgi:hypothetical protein
MTYEIYLFDKTVGVSARATLDVLANEDAIRKIEDADMLKIQIGIASIFDASTYNVKVRRIDGETNAD